MTYSTMIDQNGRIFIPAKMRHFYNWKNGSKVSLIQGKKGIKIVTKKDKLLEVQELFKKIVKQENATEDFLKFKKSEALKEISKEN